MKNLFTVILLLISMFSANSFADWKKQEYIYSSDNKLAAMLTDYNGVVMMVFLGADLECKQKESYSKQVTSWEVGDKRIKMKRRCVENGVGQYWAKSHIGSISIVGTFMLYDAFNKGEINVNGHTLTTANADKVITAYRRQFHGK